MVGEWNYDWIVIVGFLVAFLLAISVGANDVANPFGTSVGSGALTLLQCFVLATLMETLGAMTMGGAVSDTIRKKIVNIEIFNQTGNSTETGEGGNDIVLFMIGQLSAMFGAAMWQILASIWKMPVSGTHSIVGAVVGFALMAKGPNAIVWVQIGRIVASWFISPVLSGGMAVALYKLVSKLILEATNRVERAFIFLPIFYSVVVAFNTFSILHTMNKIYQWSGDNEGEFSFQLWHFVLIGIGLGLVVYFLIRFTLVPRLRSRINKYRIGEDEFINHSSCITKIEEKLGLTMDEDIHSHPKNANSADSIIRTEEIKLAPENLEFINDKSGNETGSEPEENRKSDGSETKEMQLCFKNLQAFSACFDAFAHGGNDVGNSIGPVLALYSVAETCRISMQQCDIAQMDPPQPWIIGIGCCGIVVGLWTLGKRVIKTVGKDIAQITPARGFAIDIMAGFTVLFGSMLQIPLSTTHCKVGAVVAVSLIHDRSQVSISTFKSIAMAWIVTLPVSALISAASYLALKSLLV